MSTLFGLRLFSRKVEPAPEMTAALARGLLEVRLEVDRARQNPQQTLAELMAIGNRELRPNSRGEVTPSPVDSPFFPSAELAAAALEPTTAPQSDDAAVTEYETEYLIRLLEAHQQATETAEASSAEDLSR